MPERVSLWLAATLQMGLLLLPLLFTAESFLAEIGEPQVVLILVLANYFLLAEGHASKRAWQGAAPAKAADVSAYVSSIGLLAVMMLALVNHRSTGVGVLLMGSALVIAGVQLRVAAIRALQHCFVSQTGLINGHSLVCDGPYGWMRHPSEAGLLLITSGLASVAASVVPLLLVLVVLFPVTLWRIRREDRMLARVFEDQFATYRRQVPALIPLRSYGLRRWRRL